MSRGRKIAMSVYLPQAALALLEGIGLALSPCILPVLPFILATAITKNRLRPFMIIGGFIFSFTLFSLLSRQLLSLLNIQQDALQTGAYILLLVLGIIMLLPSLEERFAGATGGLAGWAQKRMSGTIADSTAGGFLAGALIGIVWTPCAGPILATALIQIIQAQTNYEAFITVFSFGLGASIPMLIIAVFSQYLSAQLRFLSRHANALRRGMGVLITLFALLSLSGFNIAEWVVSQEARNSAVAAQESSSDPLHLQDGLAAPYAAPPVEGIAKWLNSSPLEMKALKGQVVLIDFWTYSCINCIRTLPYIKGWHEKYKDKGLVVIGVHAPEFDFEGRPENVERAIKKFNITYPVAMDNDFTTWKNYDNHYWPAHYLIDREGRVVYAHFGEGNYARTENNIRYLLGLSTAVPATNETGDIISVLQTPETYLGTGRAERESQEAINLPLHGWHISGDWKRTPEYLESARDGDTLTLHYRARKVFIVMESPAGQTVTADILNDGAAAATTDEALAKGTIAVDSSRLYEVVKNEKIRSGTLIIRARQPGLRLFAFTFEG